MSSPDKGTENKKPDYPSDSGNPVSLYQFWQSGYPFSGPAVLRPPISWRLALSINSRMLQFADFGEKYTIFLKTCQPLRKESSA
jgi:hypothetical protein